MLSPLRGKSIAPCRAQLGSPALDRHSCRQKHLIPSQSCSASSSPVGFARHCAVYLCGVLKVFAVQREQPLLLELRVLLPSSVILSY